MDILVHRMTGISSAGMVARSSGARPGQIRAIDRGGRTVLNTRARSTRHGGTIIGLRSSSARLITQRANAASESIAPGPSSSKDIRGSKDDAWSELLSRSTAVLRTDDAEAYVLGISHVSRESCKLIEELIDSVQPDAVMLELCHERTGLLVDDRVASTGQNAWYSDVVEIEGMTDMLFPHKEALLSRLRTYRGDPVSTSGIQQDADLLLATGLFESVVPITAPPPESSWDPTFIYVDNGSRIVPGVKLSSIKYRVVPRKLPTIGEVDVVFDDVSVSDADREAVIQCMMTHIRAVEDVLGTLVDAKVALGQAAGGKYDVMYRFQDMKDFSGSMGVTARIVTVGDASKAPFEMRTSFEETVSVDGCGIGVRRQTSAPFMGSNASAYVNGDASSNGPVLLEAWPREEKAQRIAADAKTAGERGPSTAGIFEPLATLVTMTYAKYQAAAGRKVGILPGEAWRVAFAAAAKAKTPYIFLGDRVASVTGSRLVKSMITSSLPSFAAAGVAFLTTWFAPLVALKVTPSVPACLILGAAAFAAAAWPLYSPIQEIKKFSELSAKGIEKAVRVKEDLQVAGGPGSAAPPYYLWGEDALIRWPGAETPVIKERDEYMAYAIYAFLKNIPDGLTPSFVASSRESYGSTVYSYAMPKGSPAIVSPPGKGQGQFVLGDAPGESPRPKRVVAVVGSAHVRGMIQCWNEFESRQSHVGRDDILEGKSR